MDPVAESVRIELARLGLRWQQLPLAQARRAAPLVRGLAQALVDEVSKTPQQPGPSLAPAPRLPDLGPGPVIDQLTVAVYDWSRARTAEGLSPAPGAGDEALLGRLTALRRQLAENAD